MTRKVFGIILNILIVLTVLIMLVALYNVVQVKMLKKDYANFFGFTMFQVATGSMSPTIKVKDIIVVKVLSDEELQNLKVDDIVVFKQEKATITHRIIEIRRDDIITKGDANNAEDGPIKRSGIVGKVIQIIPNIGIWEKVFSTPKVYISILVTITLIGVTFLYDPDKPKEITKVSGEKTDEEK